VPQAGRMTGHGRRSNILPRGWRTRRAQAWQGDPNPFALNDLARPTLSGRRETAGVAMRVLSFTELRGPLGPGGAPVYRVRVSRKPTAAYIELLGNQLEFLPITDVVVRENQQKVSPKARRAKKGD
jgi:hypothetical protein